jgi:hypothetical protein
LIQVSAARVLESSLIDAELRFQFMQADFYQLTDLYSAIEEETDPYSRCMIACAGSPPNVYLIEKRFIRDNIGKLQ